VFLWNMSEISIMRTQLKVFNSPIIFNKRTKIGIETSCKLWSRLLLIIYKLNLSTGPLSIVKNSIQEFIEREFGPILQLLVKYLFQGFHGQLAEEATQRRMPREAKLRACMASRALSHNHHILWKCRETCRVEPWSREVPMLENRLKLKAIWRWNGC
jgi:hypothetical protein